MPVILHQDFIGDLQEQADPNFARRVFRKLFDRHGNFRWDSQDHRYDGIPNAWIRYVSQGSSAFRVIYVREAGNQVTIYRAGVHSIEDRLPPPTQANGVSVRGGVKEANSAQGTETGRFLNNLRAPSLSQLILSRRLIPHKEVCFVSPFLSQSIFGRMHKFGRLLDDLIEDGTSVTLVTRPLTSEQDISFFKDLEDRGVQLLFHERVHAKVYFFVVDEGRLSYGRTARHLIVVGSANATQSGLFSSKGVGNEELSYELPVQEREDLEAYLAHLALESIDLVKLRVELARRLRGK